MIVRNGYDNREIEGLDGLENEGSVVVDGQILVGHVIVLSKD